MWISTGYQLCLVLQTGVIKHGLLEHAALFRWLSSIYGYFDWNFLPCFIPRWYPVSTIDVRFLEGISAVGWLYRPTHNRGAPTWTRWMTTPRDCHQNSLTNIWFTLVPPGSFYCFFCDPRSKVDNSCCSCCHWLRKKNKAPPFQLFASPVALCLARCRSAVLTSPVDFLLGSRNEEFQNDTAMYKNIIIYYFGTYIFNIYMVGSSKEHLNRSAPQGFLIDVDRCNSHPLTTAADRCRPPARGCHDDRGSLGSETTWHCSLDLQGFHP